ncbi:MAG: diguanylate cyclase domain-containing protein, partial [Trebonia sp.]
MANRPLTAVYALLAFVVGAYVVFVIVRGGNANDHAIDGWFVDVVELTTSALCLVRAAVRRAGRFVALALGCGLLAWSLGDSFVTLSSSPSPPIVADLCYLCFYPFAYAAVVSLMRRRMPRAAAPTWLDGSVAGLGAAAVCAAFAFHGVAHTGSSHPLTTAMNLAYPVGDALLLALVVGGTAMHSARTKMRAKWLLVAGACTINAVGDTFNLLHSSAGASPVGAAFNATAWPIAILLMSFAAWLPAEGRAVAATEVPAGFALPGLAALAGLVILTVGSLHPVGRVALALAAAALACAGVRLGMSVGALRAITEQRHRQSLTDELTGLGNRRYLSEVFDGIVSPPAQNRSTSGALPIPVVAAQEAESAATGPTTAFLFVDLDKFKEVNDSFGHAVGDELLRQIGPRMSGSLRRADLLVRLGGDEFAAVLPDTDVSQATVVAERLTASLREPFHLADLPVQISASVGIAMGPADGTDLATLISRADAAMYRAKVSRLPFQVYDGALDDSGDPL